MGKGNDSEKSVSRLTNKRTQRTLLEKQQKAPGIEAGLRVLLWLKNVTKLSSNSWIACKLQMVLMCFKLLSDEALQVVFVEEWIKYTLQLVLKAQL